MKRIPIIIALCAAVLLFSSCTKMATHRLKRQMKPLAIEYLKGEKVTDYDSLRIDRVDTITEEGYANMTYNLLENMEAETKETYERAIALNADSLVIDSLGKSLGQIIVIEDDFLDLSNNCLLKKTGILLYMVSGSCKIKGESAAFLFFVHPDKKTLYTLDPFNNNLLYKDEPEEE